MPDSGVMPSLRRGIGVCQKIEVREKITCVPPCVTCDPQFLDLAAFSASSAATHIHQLSLDG